MFKLNLKLAWRNLLKNKVYTLVNIVGLALGLAGFIFVLLYINFEKSYDRWDPQLSEVYQVQELDHWELKEGKEEWMAAADKRLLDVFKNSLSEVDEIVAVNKYYKPGSVILAGKEPFLLENIRVATTPFFKIFPFKFIYGDASTALANPGSIVVKEQFAKRHFGDVNPIGQVIQINEQNWTEPESYTITGVVQEPETPFSVDFEVLQSYELSPASDNFYSFLETYMLVKGKPSSENLNKNAQALYIPFKTALLKRQNDDIKEYSKIGLEPSVRMIPLHQIHQNPLNGKSWLVQVKPIILLSILLLLTSIINFVNMFTAQAAARAKEVGVKKVIGANKKALVKQFLLETGLQCVFALMLGVALLEGLLPFLNNLFSLNLSMQVIFNDALIGAQLVALLILVTLLAGLYPAFFLSAYKPQSVLKGNFTQSFKGQVLRNLLVSFQFVVAVAFLIGIMIISKQISFMNDKDPGFSARGIMHLDIRFDKRIAQQIKNIDGVKYVGSNAGIISKNQNMTGSYKYKNETKELKTVLVNLEGLQALDVQLLKGRLFDPANAQDSLSSIILNESLDRSYGGNMVGKFLMVNDSIPSQVVGVIKDVQTAGFDQLIKPTVYTAAKVNATGYSNIGVNYIVKFDELKQAHVLDEIEKIWKKAYPAYPFTYSFLQDDLSKTLVAHFRFQTMVKLFSFLSIVLSLIGLFSLAAFLTKQRTKEIAIRKILGADKVSIFYLLNKRFLWMMMLANIIAWPLIYIAVEYWLKEFAYRIDMPVFPFIIAFITSVLATFLTVCIQANNAVNANPVNALKYE